MTQASDSNEAAAIAAAIARFEADMAPAGGGGSDDGDGASPWQRAALIEGVKAKEMWQVPKRGARWLW